jgi:hypothetical protein
MAFSWGAFSASTKFCARDATSTPDPALSDEMIFCALALLAAANWAAVDVVPLVAVFVVVVLDETAVVAMLINQSQC